MIPPTSTALPLDMGMSLPNPWQLLERLGQAMTGARQAVPITAGIQALLTPSPAGIGSTRLDHPANSLPQYNPGWAPAGFGYEPAFLGKPVGPSFIGPAPSPLIIAMRDPSIWGDRGVSPAPPTSAVGDNPPTYEPVSTPETQFWDALLDPIRPVARPWTHAVSAPGAIGGYQGARPQERLTELFGVRPAISDIVEGHSPPEFAEVMLSIMAQPDGLTVSATRRLHPEPVGRKRQDRKVKNKWIAGFYRVINRTFGAWSEMTDAMEVLVWSAYVMNSRGEIIPAAVHFRNNWSDVLMAIYTGEAVLDVAGFVRDFALMQLQDEMIGRSSQFMQQNLNAAGWQRDVGVAAFDGFIRRATADALSVVPTERNYDGLPLPEIERLRSLFL